MKSGIRALACGAGASRVAQWAGYRHPVQRRHPQLDSPLVHLNDARPFAAIAFLHRLLEIVRRRLRIDNRRQLKERRLHQHS
ncbi:hypothetical protein LRM35_21210 [Klebsiella variicola subsp. variicola]|nr:hypothetical protein LRM35_21210 [Klebsiella variicola subsp. variicola]